MKETRYLIDVAIETYCEEHTTEESDVLKRLERETNITTLMPRMLSGKVQGKFLSILTSLFKPKNILELGTFTGYSTICLASELPNDGHLVTIDKNPEIEDIARKYFKESGLADKIDFYIGNALYIIPRLNRQFDLVFLDADKERLLDYYKMVIDKIPVGGIILVDNILWNGKVIDKKCDDKITKEIRMFNDFVQLDERVENVLLPFRDGLMMIKKIIE
ncbi:MAG: O-methyltransferase [Bacteroidales bacterium]|jgi:predicted O-methyltransferase YrrM|nr:O-methyltransferase [Bacteroidales bacterium]